MAYDNPNLVMNKLEIFLPLTFGLLFITDSDMRDYMRDHFMLWECSYPDVNTMTFILLTKANELKDYYNKLYETTLYKYDPISNYDRWEEWDDVSNGSSTQSASGTTTIGQTDTRTLSGSPTTTTTQYQNPMGENGAVNKAVGKAVTDNELDTKDVDVVDGTTTNSSNGNASNNNTLKHRGHLYGNIGVTTSQQMIEAERNIILNICLQYVNAFNDCFMITI